MVFPFMADCNSERPSDRIYVPRDEHFGHLKSSEFLSSVIKSRKALDLHKPLLDSITSKEEFNSFDEVHELFDEVHELCEGGFEHSFPVPHVIRGIHIIYMNDDIKKRILLSMYNFSYIYIYIYMLPIYNMKVNKFDRITEVCNL